jgi:hypothetical protein
MGKIRHGGLGVIEEGNLKGRRFIIPSEVLVEKGVHATGATEYSLACLIHHKFIPQSGCPDCATELEEIEKKNTQIGL